MSDPISLYIHLPFCKKKCRYCDFFSISDLGRMPSYLKSLEREIRIRAGNNGMVKSAATLYFGGGTPSLVPLADLAALMDTLAHHYFIADDAEITFEVNPGTVDSAYLSGLRRLGINRLSIGAQSFDQQKLSVLGRVHRVDQSVLAVKGARDAGFDNIGLDLIYGLPGETEKSWERDMEHALSHNPEHLSCYMLTIEPGTPLYTSHKKGMFEAVHPDMMTEFFLKTSSFLGQAGYIHYEVSNFALGKENRARHNSAYWQMIPYQGFGPSAHSFGFYSGGPARSWNFSDINAYIHTLEKGRLPVDEREVLTVPQQAMEMILLGLRTCEGVNVQAFENISKLRFDWELKELVQGLKSQGLGQVIGEGRGERFCLTQAGMARLDSIVEAFADKIF